MTICRAWPVSMRGASRAILEARKSEVVRRISGEAFPRIASKSVLLARDSRASDPDSEATTSGGGLDEGEEMAKVARREGSEFDCAPWVHKAKELPKEEFKREVERYLTGKETEPWEIIYFKLYKSQLPVVERALEIAALMLGSDKSRGYSLEMICADFLAGAALATGGSEQSLGDSAVRRLFIPSL